MIQRTAVAQLETRGDGPETSIGRTINQAFDPRLHQRAGAHDARLQRRVKRHAAQTIITQRLRGSPERNYFRVGRRVAGSAGAIAGPGQELIICADYDRADRHFVERLRVASGIQSAPHPINSSFRRRHKTASSRDSGETPILGLTTQTVKRRNAFSLRLAYYLRKY